VYTCRFELNTAEAKRNITLEPRQAGTQQRIVLASVTEGSEAWQAGLRPEQELKGISDPNRNQVWELHGRSSFRFVRQAFKMRSPGTITLDVNTSEASAAKTPRHTANVRSTPRQDAEDKSVVLRKRSPEGTESALDTMLGTVTESEDEWQPQAQETVAEKLERNYQCASVHFGVCMCAVHVRHAQQWLLKVSNPNRRTPPILRLLALALHKSAALCICRARTRTKTEAEARMARRRERLEQANKGSSPRLFALVAAVFLLPPIVILGWAWSSGYLTQLAGQY
jgi:hypothetical protein